MHSTNATILKSSLLQLISLCSTFRHLSTSKMKMLRQKKKNTEIIVEEHVEKKEKKNILKDEQNCKLVFRLFRLFDSWLWVPLLKRSSSCIRFKNLFVAVICSLYSHIFWLVFSSLLFFFSYYHPFLSYIFHSQSILSVSFFF